MIGTLLAWTFALLGVGYWLPTLAAGIATARALVVLDRVPFDPEAPVPRTSIVVAARDEADTIVHDVDAFTAHRDEALELVLVDDRSSDGTGAAMDAAAAADPRIHAIHVEVLPDGWLGKVHALEQGRRRASGDWLLFTDADVELAPELPRRAVQFAEAHRLDALALLPSVRSEGVFVAAAVGTFARWLITGARLWRPADPARPEAFGVGACNLVRASVLDDAGGLAWLRMDVADDAALAQLVASTGGRTMLASGAGLVRVTWQQSVRGMVRGFEKYGGTGGAGSIRAAVLLASLATLGELAPWAAIALGAVSGASVPLLVGLVTIALAAIVGLSLATRLGGPRRGAIVGPAGPVLVWWMQVRAAWLEHRRGGVVWRDTFYSTEQLRAGKRYDFGGMARSARATRAKLS
jgi:hypothetical protein